MERLENSATAARLRQRAFSRETYEFQARFNQLTNMVLESIMREWHESPKLASSLLWELLSLRNDYWEVNGRDALLVMAEGAD